MSQLFIYKNNACIFLKKSIEDCEGTYKEVKSLFPKYASFSVNTCHYTGETCMRRIYVLMCRFKS